MAKLQEEIIVVKISKLIRDANINQENSVIDAEFLQSLEEVVQQLAGAGALVEVQVA
jgi:hypothetical protein